MAKSSKRGKTSGGSDRVVIGRITRVRKDGEDIKFTDYKGEKRKGKYAPVATFFAAEPDGNRAPLVSVKFEDGFEPDHDDFYYNFYLSDGMPQLDFDADAVRGGGKKGKSSKGNGKRRDEDEKEYEEESDDEDDDDEEAPF